MILFLSLIVTTVAAIYFGINKRVREVLLLLVSLAFFFNHGISSLIYVLSITIIVYGLGIWLEKSKNKAIMVIGIILLIGVLVFVKYLNLWSNLGLVIPLGLSYYSLMALGYLIEVYRGKEEAEHNLLHFASFLCFFPQSVAGPIGRSKALLQQWRAGIILHWRDVRAGFIMLLVGCVEKYVLADNLAKLTNGIFFSDYQYEGFVLIAGILLYAVRIYFDFAGYSLIAIGGSRMLGIHLMENFKSPYYSISIKEFWRRWHISLSSWFKDYLYIPLGGSRVSSIRIDFNVFLVFLASGMWHGASFGFCLWGILHGVYQIVGRHTEPFRVKLRNRLHLQGRGYTVFRRIIVFLLVAIAFLPFQITSPVQLFTILQHIWRFNPGILIDGTFVMFGLSIVKLSVLAVLTISIFAMDAYNLKRNFYQRVSESHVIVRALFYLCAFALILAMGVYGVEYNAANFIYGQF